MIDALRVRGCLLLREPYQPPFGVDVPGAKELESLLGCASDERAVAFHMAASGSFEVSLLARKRIVVQAGEWLFCFGGQPHKLLQGKPSKYRSFQSLLKSKADDIFHSKPVSRAGSTLIVCGALVFQDTLLNPLFSALPAVMQGGADADAPHQKQYGALLARELQAGHAGSRFIVARLLETLAVLTIRSHAHAAIQGQHWFRALADAHVGRALSAFHAAPGDAWSVGKLAQEAHLSASRFSTKFSSTTGMSVMQYVTSWRMNLAMRALGRGDKAIEAIAYELGYESLPAFSRSFKRYVGLPPGAYRKQKLPARI